MTLADVERRMREVDPAPASTALPDRVWSAAELLQRVNAADGDADAPHPIPMKPSGVPSRGWRRRWAVAVVAAIVVLIPGILAVWLTQSDSGGDDAATDSSQVEGVPLDPSLVPIAGFPNGEILHDESWAVVVFYLPPNCVSPVVDLIDDGARAAMEDCGPLTVSATDLGQGVASYDGLGDVPVWLAPWPLVERVAADGDLTRGELLAMQTRIEAVATSYRETRTPSSAEVAGEVELAGGETFPISGSPGSFSIGLGGTMEQATFEALAGTWDNGINRLEFRSDGMLLIDRFRSIGPAPPAGISDGTYEVDGGLLAITEAELHDCLVEEVSPSDYTSSYFALLGADGTLYLEVLADNCPKRASGFAKPYSRLD